MKPLDRKPFDREPERRDVDGSDPLLAELRALWRHENEEGIKLPPEALEAADERTQAAVGWLQVAWAEEARREASASPPASISTSRPRPRLALLLGGGLAAAAALMLLARIPPAQVAVSPSTQVAGAQPSPAPAFFEAERFVSRSDGIEVVTGSVRVVLVQPTR